MQSDVLDGRLGGSQPEIFHVCHQLGVTIIHVGFDQVLEMQSAAANMHSEVLAVKADLDEAVNTGFPAAVKSDEFSSICVELGTNKAWEGWSRIWINQILFSFLGLLLLIKISQANNAPDPAA